MAHDIQDDGFHEIQLNGKQLVFLFMAATVVSVVIFLCGVLVGRGVRAERAFIDVSAPGVATDPTPQQAPPSTPAPAGSDPTTAAAPAPAGEDLSYFKRLEKQNAQTEQLKPTASPPPAAPPVAEKAPERPAAAEKTASTSGPAPAQAPVPAVDKNATSEPGGQGFAVQIAALNVRSEADAIAKRLTSKGYSAYVLAPASGTPSVFRVRVGKFATRREADTVAARLQKEEQFKPWVTR